MAVSYTWSSDYLSQIVGNGVTFNFADPGDQVECATVLASTQAPTVRTGLTWAQTTGTSAERTGSYSLTSVASCGFDMQVDSSLESVYMRLSGAVDAAITSTNALGYASLKFKLPSLGSNYRLFIPKLHGVVVVDPENLGPTGLGSDSSTRVDYFQHGGQALSASSNSAYDPVDFPLTPMVLSGGTGGRGWMSYVPFFYLWDSSTDKGCIFMFRDTNPYYKVAEYILDSGQIVLKFHFVPPANIYGTSGDSDFNWITNDCGVEITPFSGSLFQAAKYVGDRCRTLGLPAYTSSHLEDTGLGEEYCRKAKFYTSIGYSPSIDGEEPPSGSFAFVESNLDDLTSYLGIGTQDMLVAMYHWFDEPPNEKGPDSKTLDEDADTVLDGLVSSKYRAGVYTYPWQIDATIDDIADYLGGVIKDTANTPLTGTSQTNSNTLQYLDPLDQTISEMVQDDWISYRTNLFPTAKVIYNDLVSGYWRFNNYATDLDTEDKGIGGKDVGSAITRMLAYYWTELKGVAAISTEYGLDYGTENSHLYGRDAAGPVAIISTALSQLVSGIGAAVEETYNMVDVRQYMRPLRNRHIDFGAERLITLDSLVQERGLDSQMSAHMRTWHECGMYSYFYTVGAGTTSTIPPVGDANYDLFQNYIKPLYDFLRDVVFIDWDRQYLYNYGLKLEPPVGSHEYHLANTGLDHVRVGRLTDPSNFRSIAPSDTYPRILSSVHLHPTDQSILIRCSNWSDESASYAMELTVSDHLSNLGTTFDVFRVTGAGYERLDSGVPSTENYTLTVSPAPRSGEMYYLLPPTGQIPSVTSVQALSSGWQESAKSPYRMGSTPDVKPDRKFYDNS